MLNVSHRPEPSLNPGIQAPGGQHITSLSYNQDSRFAAMNLAGEAREPAIPMEAQEKTWQWLSPGARVRFLTLTS